MERVNKAMNDIINKFSSLKYAKKLWDAQKKEEIAVIDKEHETILDDKNRMIEVQEQEIKVKKSVKNCVELYFNDKFTLQCLKQQFSDVEDILGALQHNVLEPNCLASLDQNYYSTVSY